MKPFYRSKLFGFGLVGFIFLLWAWERSYRFESALHWRFTPGQDLYCANYGGQLAFTHTAFPPSGTPCSMFFRESETRRTFPLPPAIKTGYADSREYSENEMIFRVLKLAHWFLILIYLVFWIGAMAFRRWRTGRRAAIEAMLSETQGLSTGSGGQP